MGWDRWATTTKKNNNKNKFGGKGSLTDDGKKKDTRAENYIIPSLAAGDTPGIKLERPRLGLHCVGWLGQTNELGSVEWMIDFYSVCVCVLNPPRSHARHFLVTFYSLLSRIEPTLLASSLTTTKATSVDADGPSAAAAASSVVDSHHIRMSEAPPGNG